MTFLSEDDVWGAYETLLSRKRRSPATIGLYRTALHDLWTFLAKRGARWCEVTPELVDAWLERACKPGKHGAGMPLSRGTRNTYGRVVLRYYRRAATRGWLQANPLEDWEPPAPPGRRPRALPVSAVGQLLVKLASNQRLCMIVMIGYHQGLRIGEISRLSVEDVALNSDPPQIRIEGKGDQEVWMDLSEALIGGLRAFLLTRPASGPLIPNFRDPARHLDPKYASALLAAAMRPVVGDSGHALRRTGATQLARITKDPFIVQAFLRHASLDTLNAYVGAPELAAALAKLPDPLHPSSPAAGANQLT